jgi:hypothetical protein
MEEFAIGPRWHATLVVVLKIGQSLGSGQMELVSEDTGDGKGGIMAALAGDGWRHGVKVGQDALSHLFSSRNEGLFS